jgi:hypothetical protein
MTNKKNSNVLNPEIDYCESVSMTYQKNIYIEQRVSYVNTVYFPNTRFKKFKIHKLFLSNRHRI